MNFWKKTGLLSSVVALLAGVGYMLYRKPRSLRRITHQKNDSNSPNELSKSDWKNALKETKDALGNKNIPMLAAGVAFFATLAFFPTLTAFISIFSLVAEPSTVASAITSAEQYLPNEVASLVSTQLQATAGKQTLNLIAAIVAIILALWGASGGMQNLIKALNEAYDVEETRGFVKLKLVSIGLVLAGIIIGFPMLFLLIVQGEWLTALGTPEWLANSFLILRWVLITLLAVAGLAAFYRYGPDRENPKWQWVSWGAVGAIIIWLLGTLLFFFYAQNFGNFSKSYGIFAGIIVLMTWLNLSSFIILIGAQVNHRLETKTGKNIYDKS